MVATREGFSRARLAKLYRSLKWSRQRLEKDRERRNGYLLRYMGNASEKAHDRVAINLMRMAFLVYLRQLSPRNPRCLVETDFPNLQAAAANQSALIDKTAKQLELGRELRACAFDALCGLGILKVGHESVGMVQLGQSAYQATGPFVEAVDIDDWVHDDSASRYERCAYAGQRLSLGYDEVMESDAFPKRAKAFLRPTDRHSVDDDGTTRARSLDDDRDDYSDADEYNPQVEVWELHLPSENRTIVIPAEFEGPVLRSRPWEGPPCGPYLLLSFHEMPNRIRPIPPANMWDDLHDLSNVLFNKLARQAKRQKTITAVAPGGGDSAEAIQDAGDGDVVKVPSPDKTREITFGGPHQLNQAFFLSTKELFNYVTGNIDLSGGLAAQTQTVGQEQLLAQAGTQQLGEMQDRVMDLAAKMFQAIGWIHWRNPIIDEVITRRVKSLNVTVTDRYTAGSRAGKFWQYNFQLAPYSLKHLSPAQQLAVYRAFLREDLLPFFPQIQQAGIEMDWVEHVRRTGELAGIPGLESLLIIGPRPPEGPGPSGDTPVNPNKPNGHYTREERSGPTQSGHARQMEQILAGAASGRPMTGAMR